MSQPVDSREVRESASEVKFLLEGEVANRIRGRVRALLSPDPYASGPNSDEYGTTTIYFDTTDFDVYHRRGSYRRAKYRVRRYGQGDTVFLERKLRTSEMLSKRRTNVHVNDLPLLTATAPDHGWSGRWFHQRLLMRKLQPVCQVSYRRTARVGMTDHGPIRLTFDEDLRGWPVDDPAFDGSHGARMLTTHIIMEMKFRADMPAVFKRVVEEFALRPTRISKYRIGIEATRPGIAGAQTAVSPVAES